MKRCSLAIVFIMFGSIVVNAQPRLNDLQKWKLHGKVKSIVEHYWLISNDRAGDTSVYTINFNTTGYITDRTSVYKDGNSSEKYDGKGNELESTDKHGIKVIYNYNSKGNISEKDDGDPEYGGKTLYKYDANDSLIEETHYNDKGVLDAKSVYKYADGKRIEYDDYDEGALAEKELYKYNDKGIQNEVDSYVKDSLSAKRYYYYNALGDETSSIEYDSEGKVSDSDSTVYDDHENMVLSKDVNPDMGEGPLMHYYSYEYDSASNYITKLSYDNISGEKSLSEQVVRMIIYY